MVPLLWILDMAGKQQGGGGWVGGVKLWTPESTGRKMSAESLRLRKLSWGTSRPNMLKPTKLVVFPGGFSRKYVLHLVGFFFLHLWFGGWQITQFQEETRAWAGGMASLRTHSEPKSRARFAKEIRARFTKFEHCGWLSASFKGSKLPAFAQVP